MLSRAFFNFFYYFFFYSKFPFNDHFEVWCVESSTNVRIKAFPSFVSKPITVTCMLYIFVSYKAFQGAECAGVHTCALIHSGFINKTPLFWRWWRLRLPSNWTLTWETDFTPTLSTSPNRYVFVFCVFWGLGKCLLPAAIPNAFCMQAFPDFIRKNSPEWIEKSKGLWPNACFNYCIQIIGCIFKYSRGCGIILKEAFLFPFGSSISVVKADVNFVTLQSSKKKS